MTPRRRLLPALNCLFGRSILPSLGVVFLLAVICPPVLARDTPYALSGTVRDHTTGAPVVSARITVLNYPAGDTLAANVFTDARGRYRIQSLQDVSAEQSALPLAYRVEELYPNPRVAGLVTIRYATPGNRPETPDLLLFDLLGRRLPAQGIMAGGLYFYSLRFQNGYVSSARPLMLVEGGGVRIHLEQTGGFQSDEEDPVIAAAAASGPEVRITVEKPGFDPLETTRNLSFETDNIFDFELIRTATARARLVVAVTNTAGERLQDVAVEVVDASLTGHTNVLGETALDSVHTGIPIVLKLSKAGYMEQFVRTEVPAGFRRSTARAVLRPRAPSSVIPDAAAGAAVTGVDGARIELPPDALVDADGMPVSGSVTLNMTPLDVTDDDQLSAFPGIFEGFDAEGVQRPLVTLGVTEFVLEQNGQKLNLADGKKALVELPLYVETDELGNPLREGDTVPLWWLDEGTGVWIYETVGTVAASAESPTGMVLRGEISHFSLFNCDIAVSTYSTQLTSRVSEDMCHTYNGSWSEQDGTCEVSEPVCMRLSGRLPEVYRTRQTSTAIFCGTHGLDGPDILMMELHRTESNTFPAFENLHMAIDAVSVAGMRMSTLAPADIDLTMTLETAPTLLPGREGLHIGRWTGTMTGGPDEAKEQEIDFTFVPLETGGHNELISIPAELSRAINELGTTDTYRFEAEAGEFVLLDVCRLPQSTLEGRVILRETGGLALDFRAFGSSCGNLQVSIPHTGSYTIEVIAEAGTPGGYSLSLRGVAAAFLDVEYRDTVSVSGAWHIYSLTLEREELVVLAANVTEASNLGMTVYLVDREGTVLVDQTVLIGNAQAVTRRLEAGTYFVYFVPRNNGTASYFFVLRPIVERSAELGTLYEGTIDRSFAFDRYRFVLDEAGTIVITSRPVGMDVFGMRTSVKDVEGRELAGRSHNNERDLEVTLDAGTYFLELVPARGQLGSYWFVIQREP